MAVIEKMEIINPNSKVFAPKLVINNGKMGSIVCPATNKAVAIPVKR